MTIASASVDRDIVPRRVDRSRDLTVTTNTHMFGSISGRLNSIQHQIAGLIVSVQNSVPVDVDVACEINRGRDSRLNNNLAGAANRNVAGNINLDISLVATRISCDSKDLVS